MRRRVRIYTGEKEVVYDPFLGRLFIILSSGGIVVFVDLSEIVRAVEKHGYRLKLVKVG